MKPHVGAADSLYYRFIPPRKLMDLLIRADIRLAPWVSPATRPERLNCDRLV